MAVVATARNKRVLWRIAYAILSFVLGFWGAYDYWILIPRHELEYAEFSANKETFDLLEAKAASSSLSESEIRSYTEAKSVLQRFKDATPEPVPAYDRPLQLWVYIIGCGVLGGPWALHGVFNLRRQRLELDNDGNLTMNGVSLKCEQIQTIDMSRWMSKSIATVRGTNGESITIDDYLLQDAHLIIGRIANRFDPASWNLDGTKVKPPEVQLSDSTDATEVDASARDSH